MSQVQILVGELRCKGSVYRPLRRTGKARFAFTPLGFSSCKGSVYRPLRRTGKARFAFTPLGLSNAKEGWGKGLVWALVVISALNASAAETRRALTSLTNSA